VLQDRDLEQAWPSDIPAICALILGSLLVPAHVWAQAGDADGDGARSDRPDEFTDTSHRSKVRFRIEYKPPRPTIEEVTVRAPKPMSAHRKGIEDAVDAVWEAFNARNSSDEFDVTCRDERPTGTLIPKRVCRSNALREATAEGARAMAAGRAMGYGGGRGSFAAARAHNMRLKLGNELRGVANSFPELAERFEELAKREEAYDEARKRRQERQ
jgi:hypothetical protein